MEPHIQRELEIIKDGILKTVPAEAIYLFGSYASGAQNEDSDIDIYVVVPDNIEDLIEVRAGIRMSLRKKRSRDLDLLLGRSSAFHRRKEGPTLERAIAKNGVQIYG
jgi:predicted nucleotidyltransferase